MIIYLLSTLISIYTWVLIAYAFLSWVPQIARSRVGYVIMRLARPYLRLFDRIPTRFGVFDFQVMLAVVVLIIIQWALTVRL